MDILTATQTFLKLSSKNILNIDPTPDLVEDILNSIVESMEDADVIEKELGIALRQLVKLMSEIRHSDDKHHYGESILEHTKVVLGNIDKLCGTLDDKTKRLMKLAALFHDIGKVYTFEVNKGKHTFRGHPDVSFNILSKWISQYIDADKEFCDKLLTLVKRHDDITDVLNAASVNSGIGYLKNFLKNDIYTKKMFDLFKLFVRADSVTDKALEETEKGIEKLDNDIAIYERTQKEREEKKNRSETITENKLNKLTELLKDKPEILNLLPNMKIINAELGKAKEFDLLRKVKQIMEEE